MKRPGARPASSPSLLPLLALVLVVLGACAPTPAPAPESPAPPPLKGPGLAALVEAVTAAPPMDQVHWGILAVDREDGSVLYARNEALKFVPASNMKVPVTAAGLHLLGTDRRWRTALHAGGPVRDGVVHGPLLLPATGDPTLGEPFHPSGRQALEALADSLRAAGIERVEGALLVDVSAWDSTSVPSTWMVGNVASRFGASGGAFAVDAGELEVVVSPAGRPGEAARVEWRPFGDSAFVGGSVVTRPAGAATELRTSYLPESRRMEVTGSVRLDRSDTLRIAVRDPVGQGAAALLRALESRGIVVEEGLVVAWDPGRLVGPGCLTGSLSRCPGAPEVAALESPPMAEVARAILRPSQNWMTEQLVRTLGSEVGSGGSWPAGLEVVRAFLEEVVEVDPLDLELRDGSGLSAYNLLTPRSLVRTFKYMADSPHAAEFRAAMAAPGVKETTLESRLTDLEGRLFAKTGTISNVNALSGHLIRRDGHEILFSVLTNGSGLPAATVRDAMDDVVRVLAGERPGAPHLHHTGRSP